MKYIKQLDSLRAIAVTFVVIGHYFPSFYIWKYFPIGSFGVDLFFVLSGFLITNILISQRDLNDSFKSTKMRLILNFYIRRILRIFPIYYLFVIFIYLFSSIVKTNVDSAFPYLLTYTVNIYFFKKQGFSGEISHLWTLAVEEQFYLIWPWLVLFTKKYFLLYIISFFILIGVLGKILMANNRMGAYLTFNCFDAFGFGALLSYFYLTPNMNLFNFKKLITISAVISFLLFIYGFFDQRYVPLRTLISIIAVFIINNIVMNTESRSLFFRYVLNNKVFIFIGKISYGIYIYHLIILSFVNSKYFNLHINSLLPDILYRKYWNYLFLFENIFLLLLVSWLSFIFIETKFLNFKKYFIYNS